MGAGDKEAGSSGFSSLVGKGKKRKGTSGEKHRKTRARDNVQKSGDGRIVPIKPSFKTLCLRSGKMWRKKIKEYKGGPLCKRTKRCALRGKVL